jgi:MFS family permease
VLSRLTQRFPEVLRQTTDYFDLNNVRQKLGINTVDQRLRIPWHILRDNSGFRWYFIASVTSDFGTWLQNSAQVLLAYQLAHSVLAVSMVTFAQFAGPLMLGPWAGVAADKFGGRRMLIFTQVVSAGVAAVLSAADFAGLLNVWGLVIGAAFTGLAFTFALPARNITVQRLVPRGRLKSAFAMDSVSYNLGRAVAPLLTMAMAWTGISFAWAFAVNAASFIIFSVILWRIDRGAEPEPGQRSRVRDGFMIARKDRRILILLLMVAAVTIADDPILVLGPAIAKQLHASPMWSSWFIAAFGTGTILRSFRPSRHQSSLRLAATALAALAGFMLLFVNAPTMWVGVIAALAAGTSCLVANSVTRAALAEHAGSDRVTAVMAVWALAWAGSKPFASLIDGALGSWIGPQWTGVILAIPALIPFLVIMLEPRNRLLATDLHVSPS